jgi:hypothetical protein
MPEVSLLATVVGAVASFVLGALWYGPLFSNAWMAEHGFTVAELTKGFNPAKAYGLTLVLALLAAYVFGAFLGPDVTPAFGASAGAAAGLFWVSGSVATNYIFERASLRLWLIDGATTPSASR